jgi:hypothetical protein
LATYLGAVLVPIFRCCFGPIFSAVLAPYLGAVLVLVFRCCFGPRI